MAQLGLYQQDLLVAALDQALSIMPLLHSNRDNIVLQILGADLHIHHDFTCMGLWFKPIRRSLQFVNIPFGGVLDWAVQAKCSGSPQIQMREILKFSKINKRWKSPEPLRRVFEKDNGQNESQNDISKENLPYACRFEALTLNHQVKIK